MHAINIYSVEVFSLLQIPGIVNPLPDLSVELPGPLPPLPLLLKPLLLRSMILFEDRRRVLLTHKSNPSIPILLLQSAIRFLRWQDSVVFSLFHYLHSLYVRLRLRYLLEYFGHFLCFWLVFRA